MKDQQTMPASKQIHMILECTARPRLALAEGAEGTKAICSGLKDILWFSEYIFPALPESTAPVNMKVVSADTPRDPAADGCNFTVEVDYEENYNLEDILNTIRRKTFCTFRIKECSQPSDTGDYLDRLRNGTLFQ
ncbi:hypothetical protein SAMN06265348_102107 [Pedobacter westerhofensis]|uniref:Uncharacterized protein n=1 Tax=Pedobacter westerhofensis TaxID=425512 RepID=A0A521BAN6_9SPHI|nr:hypothetical protein [Pedobacter westerhofensis]SMO43780.1 hypothetical protein SAMN06265348_102107 [Pedobacter westerhofensis]